MVTLSTEQFQQLLSTVAQQSERCGSFSSCLARYNGVRDPAKVEEFIAAISTYKLVENISDGNAVNGMPMLLEGEAAEWWRGVKDSAKKFDDVIKMLRQTFSPKRLAWRIYAEIYEIRQQNKQATDSFVSRKRVLFAELPSPPEEADQIDMIFGLLRSDIRERVMRHKIGTFDQLLTDAREAEQILKERDAANADSVNQTSGSAGGTTKRCTFCRMKGHTVDMCRKKKGVAAIVAPAPQPSAGADAVKPKVACFGCGTPGVWRANCLKCRKKVNSDAPMPVHFNSLGLCVGREIPVANVEMFGVPGQAFFDSGARTSVASTNLKRIMDFHGCQYESIDCNVSLADGSTTQRKCLTTTCEIGIGGRKCLIKFLIFTGDQSNKTLIGTDFMEELGVVLNMAQQYWFFEDSPKETFDFGDLLPFNLNVLETIKVANTNPKRDSAVMTASKQLNSQDLTPKRFCQTNVSDFENYGPDYIQNEYSPRGIQRIFGSSLPTTMITPDRNKDSGLFTGVVRAKQPEFDGSEFVSFCSLDLQILKPSDGLNLSENEKLQLDGALLKHIGVFNYSGDPTPFAIHQINTGNHEPIATPPYRLSFAKTRELKREIETMLENDVIEECESAWSSPVVMVPKRDGSIRVCVDYRKLNSITVPDRYPLPRLDDLLHAAKSTKYMTTLDLQSGYYQIEVALEDRDKTCLITPFGTFRFTRMPFGLRNAPATFQRLINTFKTGIPNVCILAYLDDVIICSETFQKHLEDLDIVFKRLAMFQLRLNNQKCSFCCSKVKYLGHFLTPEGIAIDTEKTKAIIDRKEPKNIKQLISFIQTCSWYRKFIDNYADIARPLTNLTKKSVAWKWEKPQMDAFNALKNALVTSPVLRQAVDGIPFAIKTDSSAYALGAVLIQGEKNDEHPIEYASRLLNNAERNYSTTEREALAIVWACNKFRGYIEGAEVKLLTDHQPLKWLLTVKSPTGRIARWGLQIQHYNLVIEYLPGKTNSVADMLSRPPCSDESHDERSNCICAFYVDMPTKSTGEIRSEQMKDENLKDIITSLETNDENSLRWINRSYLLNDGILYCYGNDDSEDAQLVVPAHERSEILKVYHDESTAGHYGSERTIARIASRYFWPGMRSEISKYVKSCIECQRFKASNMKPAGLLQTTSSKQRFEVVAVDLFGPLPQTENGDRWILIVEDVASRWTEIFALSEATAEACAKILIEEIFLRYGIPRRIKSDNGVQFVSAIMQKVTYCLGIQQQFTPVYHPEANPVERKNRDMKSQLAILVQRQHDDWHLSLSAIRFAMNTAKCQSTGYSAAFLTFGRELRTVDDIQHDVKAIVESENFIPEISSYLAKMVDVLKNAKETESKAQDRNKHYADQHRRPQPQYEVGTQVLITTHVLSNASKNMTSKFIPKRDGPYVITKKIGSSTYEVSSPDNLSMALGSYHASALTPFEGTNAKQHPAPVCPLKKRGRPKKKVDQ